MKRVIIALSILACMLLITGCSSEPQSGTYYMDYTENYEIENSFAKDFYGNVTVSITDIQESTSSGTVNVVVPDLKKIYMEHRDEFHDNLTEDQIRRILTKNLHEFVVEESFDVELYQDNDIWKVSSTEQIDGLLADVVDDYLRAVLADTELKTITIDISTEDMWK